MSIMEEKNQDSSKEIGYLLDDQRVMEIDIFFTSFIHIPDEDNIQHENWILSNLGISVPLVR